MALLQKFLRGMRPDERSRLNDAAGGSAMHLTMNEMWDLIDDLAVATKRTMHQTDRRAQTVEDVLRRRGETIVVVTMDESETESTEEKPTWEITPEPSEELDPLTPESEALGPFDQEAHGAPEAGPVPINELSGTYPVLSVRAPGDRNEPERRMEKRAQQDDSLIEHSLATTRQGSPENKRARLKGPMAMVKRSSPTWRNVKANPPDYWIPDSSTSFHGDLGRIKKKAEVKFDLTRPWDPNQPP